MTRGTALLSVAALFLSGVSIGALGMHLYHAYGDEQQAVNPPLRPAMDGPPRHMMDFIAEQLELTDEQLSEIRQIHEQARIEGRAIREELRPRVEARIEETRQKINRVLSQEQRERFEELRAQHGGPIDRFMVGEGRRGFGPPGRGFRGRRGNHGPRSKGPPPPQDAP